MLDCCFDISHVVTHFASAFAAALGGSSMMVYLQPATVKEAAVRLGVSVGAGTMLAPTITRKIFDDPVTDIHVIAGVSFAVGFLAWSTLGAVARYFEHRRTQDAVQLYQEVKK